MIDEKSNQYCSPGKQNRERENVCQREPDDLNRSGRLLLMHVSYHINFIDS